MAYRLHASTLTLGRELGVSVFHAKPLCMRVTEPGVPFVPTQEDFQQYRRLRIGSRDLNQRLVETVPTGVLHEVAEHLGIRQENGAVALPSEDAVAVLMDACIHGWLVEGKTVLEAFRQRQAESGHPRLSDLEAEVLAANADVYHSVFQIQGAIEGMGVYAQDGFRDESFFLMDEVLSRQAGAAECWVSSRLVTHGCWKMTTGAMLTLGTMSKRRAHKVLQVPWQRARDHGLDSKEAERMASLAFTALGLEYMAGAEPAPSLPPDPVPSVSMRPGRNRPCPCGSLKKFKYCCGR